MTQESQPHPRKAPKISRRTFLGGIAAGALALVGCKPGESASTTSPSTKPNTSSTTIPGTTTELPTTTFPDSPTTIVDKDYEILPDRSFLYKGEKVGLPESFGGFNVDLDFGGSEKLGFTDTEVGPKSLYNEFLKILISQGDGKYGNTPEEVQLYLDQNNGIIPEFFTFEIVADQQRVPPWVDKKSQSLDTTKPIKISISNETLPGVPVTRFFGSNSWQQIGIVDGQLIFVYDKESTGIAAFDLPEGTAGYGDVIGEIVSSSIGVLWECLSRADEANGSTEKRPDDLLSHIIEVEMADALHDTPVPGLNLDNTVFFYQDDANTVIVHKIFGVVD